MGTTPGTTGWSEVWLITYSTMTSKPLSGWCRWTHGVVDCSEERVHLGVVGDVVSPAAHRAPAERRQPDPIDTQGLGEVVELADHAAQSP